PLCSIAHYDNFIQILFFGRKHNIMLLKSLYHDPPCRIAQERKSQLVSPVHLWHDKPSFFITHCSVSRIDASDANICHWISITAFHPSSRVSLLYYGGAVVSYLWFSFYADRRFINNELNWPPTPASFPGLS